MPRPGLRVLQHAAAKAARSRCVTFSEALSACTVPPLLLLRGILSPAPRPAVRRGGLQTRGARGACTGLGAGGHSETFSWQGLDRPYRHARISFSAARHTAAASSKRHLAQVAELVDAPGSGPGGGNTVEVRVLSWAPRFRKAGSMPAFSISGREAAKPAALNVSPVPACRSRSFAM